MRTEAGFLRHGGHGQIGFLQQLPGAVKLVAAQFLGRRDDALAALRIYLDANATPNAFYNEGTLEVGFSFCQSMHGLLLQSRNGLIRVFPAAWDDAVFHNPRTEGAFLVSAARKNGKTQRVRVKSLAGERMVHAQGLKNARIINDTGKAYGGLGHDAWDQRHHDRTLEYLEFYQAAGGRADEYIAESWYRGPYTFFPETKPGTFSNLARDLIRRPKGLDDQSKPMPLDLAVRIKGQGEFAGTGVYQETPQGDQAIVQTVAPGGSVEFDLKVSNTAKNRLLGDARATPLLRASPSGGGWRMTCTDPAGRDITPAILAHSPADGWFVGGINPGESRIIHLKPTAPGTPSPQTSLRLDL